MAAARAALGEATFPAAWTAGSALSLDEATDETSQLALQATVPDSAALGTPERLTDREHEVLRFLVVGWSDREIAAMLGIGRRTVSNHVAAIRAKLAAPSRSAVAAIAVRDRLV
jgi:DNA-binding NarL/FixJ family response regulator